MKKIKPRKDCFFGLHFDLHANDKDTELGKNLSEKTVETLIKTARPDYIQYDCKGHCGFLAYPKSKVSVTAGSEGGKGIVKDSLAIYRKVTRKHGVGLYMHFSGIVDEQAYREYPEWGMYDETGKLRESATMSTFSPYLKERMLPQMLEIVERYDVDGFWVDGDGWAHWPDYHPEAVKIFKEKTGMKKAPAKPGEPGWLEWSHLQRDFFLAYVRKYCDALKAVKPSIQICSNWLGSRMSPLPKEKIPTDFLSGDFGWYGSMPVGQFEARFFAGTGKPWDLMLWGWIGVPAIGALYKSPRQLCQESATVLAQGGGLEVYYQPDRDGDFSKFHLNCMNVLGQFARKRKKLCWKSETVPQVASLIDTRSFWSKSPAILNSWNGEYRPFMGALNATISAGHSVDILTDVQLASRLKDYPVLMITEWEQFAPGTVRQIQSYVHDGGNLLLMGAGTSRIFADLLDVEFQNDPREGTFLVQVPKDSRGRTFSHLTSITGPWQDITPGKKTKVLAHRTDKPHEGRNPQPVATVNRCGKGQVACFYGALGKGLYLSHAPGLREIIAVMLDALYTPLARIKNDDCGEIELSLRRQKGQILIHLINANNMCTSECVTGPDGNALTNAGNYPLVDRIPAVGPITIQLQLPHKPRSIRLEPEGIKLPVKSVGKNRYEVTLPKLDIHAIVTID